jgi:hypothetical protein
VIAGAKAKLSPADCGFPLKMNYSIPAHSGIAFEAAPHSAPETS